MTITGPAHWAPYLLGEEGRPPAGEMRAVVDWLIDNGGPVIHGIEGEPYFSWNFGFYGLGAEGGMVVDYVV